MCGRSTKVLFRTQSFFNEERGKEGKSWRNGRGRNGSPAPHTATLLIRDASPHDLLCAISSQIDKYRSSVSRVLLNLCIPDVCLDSLQGIRVIFLKSCYIRICYAMQRMANRDCNNHLHNSFLLHVDFFLCPGLRNQAFKLGRGPVIIILCGDGPIRLERRLP